MHVPRECYQLMDELEQRLPSLDPVQRRGLALWLWGTITAGSACQSAVTSALLPCFDSEHAVRQYLREWLYDGKDRAHPVEGELAVEDCFAELLGWVVEWWQGTRLPLAIDATLVHNRVAVLSISVLYRGCAIPVAWKVLPALQPGAWVPEIVALLARLGAAVPDHWTVLVMTDRGLWSPRIWQQIQDNGWHPLMRIHGNATFTPCGRSCAPACTLVDGPHQAWVGKGTAFTKRRSRRQATLVVMWEQGQREPWLLLTDLEPEQVGVAWYGLRIWVELGFRALKRMGWHWERSRRTTPVRVARHWLVLAVATLWTLAVGSRGEDAQRLGVVPQRLRAAPTEVLAPGVRTLSVFGRGLTLVRGLLLRQRRLWRRLWLLPETWPEPPPGLAITRHIPPQEVAHA